MFELAPGNTWEWSKEMDEKPQVQNRHPGHPLAGDIFLAHAASLRHVDFFARLKFRGFLHSFNRRDRAPKLVLGFIVRATRRSESVGQFLFSRIPPFIVPFYLHLNYA